VAALVANVSARGDASAAGDVSGPGGIFFVDCGDADLNVGSGGERT
jgi:hypothetical protein